MNRAACCTGILVLSLALCGCQSAIFKPNLGSHFRLPHWAGGSKPVPDLPESLDQPAATDETVDTTEPTRSGGDHASILTAANEAFRNGRLTDATEHYQGVLKLVPDHTVAHHRLAIIADRQRDYAEADHHYQAAVKSSSRNANLLSDFAYSKMLRSDLDASKTLLRQALAIDPTHSHALYNLGLVQGRQGHYDAALETFRKAGSEADAQANISRLFPQGRPALTSNDPTIPSVPRTLSDPEPNVPLVPLSQPSLSNIDPVAIPAGAKEPILSPDSRTIELPSEFQPPPTTVDLPSQPILSARPIPTTTEPTDAGITPARSTKATTRIDPEFSRSAARLGLSIGPGSLLPYASTAPQNGAADAPATTPVAAPSKLIPAPAATRADPLSTFETELQDDSASEREAVRRRLNPSPGPTTPTIP